MKEKIKEALESVCNKDGFREFIKKPFVQNVYGKKCAIATDSLLLVCYSGLQDVIKDYELNKPEYVPIIENVFEKNILDSASEEIRTKELLDLLGFIPSEPKYEEIECAECDGKGTVIAFIYETSTGKDMPIECDCPVCDGYGVFLTNKIIGKRYDSSYLIKIKEAYFNPQRVYNLYTFLNKVGIETIKFTTSQKQRLYFKTNEFFGVLIGTLTGDEKIIEYKGINK